MNRLPPWIQSSTRPTTDEVERVVGAFDPQLARFARDATAPTAFELASLRRREPRRRANPSLTALAVVLAGAAAMGLLWMEPESLVVTERPIEAGIYRVTTAEDLSPILGVWVQGEGSVEVEPDGRLALDGDLLLTVTAPVVFEVGEETFTAGDAIVWVDGTGLRIAAGRVEGAGRVWTAGERWTLPDAVVAIGPSELLPEPLQEPAPEPQVRSPEVLQPPVGREAAPVREIRPPQEITPQQEIAPSQEIAPPQEIAPLPEVAPVPVLRAPEPAPPGPGPSPIAPATAPVPPNDVTSAALGWRDVLIRLEQGGTADDRIAALRSYQVRYPDSPFEPEAEALMLLIPGAQGEPRARLGDLERWLGRNPDAARSVEVHALAARIAREGLQDCGRAAPHDRVVAAATSGASRAKAQAFLGLCEIASGRPVEGQALLDGVDPGLLDPALRRAVVEARRGSDP